MQEQSRNEIGRRSIEVEEWKIAFPSRTWSDGDEAEWERGREWLREWAAIWAKSGGRWWRGREAEMRDVIERVSSEGEVESSKSDWNLREWGEDFKVSICFTCMLISPNNIVWEKKNKEESPTVPFKAWNKGIVWTGWTGHGSQNQVVEPQYVRIPAFFCMERFFTLNIGVAIHVCMSSSCRVNLWVFDDTG